ncbi:hypothetical protein JAAARDRAFT_197440 [Jaapia argillacea MUCL 33604]|uniref:Uncharacterized protein n=1 Tax=Jaapia argillacea MUCL 33604 TaxID=933084 RepID=A0A067PFF6_9AGAM|nr:hypothetical protein JAAARDRAFT_197440 [Jaapia argillacea MUCL 33604]
MFSLPQHPSSPSETKIILDETTEILTSQAPPHFRSPSPRPYLVGRHRAYRKKPVPPQPYPSLSTSTPPNSPLSPLSTSALLALFTLDRTRRESLQTRLNQPPFVSDTGPASCSACGRAISYATWRNLKYVMILEMDCRPLWDEILNAGLETWREAKACWDARCGGQECKRVLYDKAETVRVVRECIEQLPKCI